MTKTPSKPRIPIEGWAIALLVTFFSLISSVFHAKLVQADPVVASAIR